MKRTPLRRVSRKRQATQPAYNEFRQTILERDDGCMFWHHAHNGPFTEPVASLVGAPIYCFGRVDVHHIILRSRWKAGLMVPSNVRCLCEVHHRWCHDNEAKARTIGLIGNSWARPS